MVLIHTQSSRVEPLKYRAHIECVARINNNGAMRAHMFAFPWKFSHVPRAKIQVVSEIL